MKTIIPKEWFAVLIHVLLVAAAGGFTLYKVGEEAALTLCAGGGVSLLTLAGVVWTTRRLIAKKPIALTAFSIVLKYALLGWIMYYLTQNAQMDILWIGLGVSLILPSLFIFGLLAEKGLDENEDEL